MGHLYKGLMWFKKKSYMISDGYSIEHAPDGTDLRMMPGRNKVNAINNNAVLHLPLVSERDHFFSLAPLGFYVMGVFHLFGQDGFYWSSNTYSESSACGLYITGGSGVRVISGTCNIGCRVQTFE